LTKRATSSRSDSVTTSSNDMKLCTFRSGTSKFTSCMIRELAIAQDCEPLPAVHCRALPPRDLKVPSPPVKSSAVSRQLINRGSRGLGRPTTSHSERSEPEPSAFVEEGGVLAIKPYQADRPRRARAIRGRVGLALDRRSGPGPRTARCGRGRAGSGVQA
jgi:hypothetical protein